MSDEKLRAIMPPAQEVPIEVFQEMALVDHTKMIGRRGVTKEEIHRERNKWEAARRAFRDAVSNGWEPNADKIAEILEEIMTAFTNEADNDHKSATFACAFARHKEAMAAIKAYRGETG